MGRPTEDVTHETYIAEVEVDARHRLPLAKLVDPHQTRFRVAKLPGGDYLLTPVVSISERELTVLRDPMALARLRRGIDEAAAGKVVRHGAGHFVELAVKVGDEDETDSPLPGVVP